MALTSRARTIDMLLQAIEGFRDRKPDATADDVIGLIKTVRDQLVAESEPSASCKRCGVGIWEGVDGRWRHDDPDNSRGCRAASFRPSSGWNEDLDRSWMAQPGG